MSKPLYKYNWPYNIPFENEKIEVEVFPFKSLTNGLASLFKLPLLLLGSFADVLFSEGKYFDIGEEIVEDGWFDKLN
jgi:hypothetical protein